MLSEEELRKWNERRIAYGQEPYKPATHAECWFCERVLPIECFTGSGYTAELDYMYSNIFRRHWGKKLFWVDRCSSCANIHMTYLPGTTETAKTRVRDKRIKAGVFIITGIGVIYLFTLDSLVQFLGLGALIFWIALLVEQIFRPSKMSFYRYNEFNRKNIKFVHSHGILSPLDFIKYNKPQYLGGGIGAKPKLPKRRMTGVAEISYPPIP